MLISLYGEYGDLELLKCFSESNIHRVPLVKEERLFW